MVLQMKKIANYRLSSPSLPLCLNPNCNKPFKPARKWQKFCSDKCRLEKWDSEHPRVSKEEFEKLKELLKK